MAVQKTVSLSFRVSGENAKQLEDLSRATDRPRSWLLERALKDYLETHAWQVAHTRRGLEDLESGRGVAHEKVEAWLQTWGSVNETEPPE
jgi:predicted transcriptional regulator